MPFPPVNIQTLIATTTIEVELNKLVDEVIGSDVQRRFIYQQQVTDKFDTENEKEAFFNKTKEVLKDRYRYKSVNEAKIAIIVCYPISNSLAIFIVQ